MDIWCSQGEVGCSDNAAKNAVGPKWQCHFFYRKESLKPTWKLRLALLILVILLLSMTHEFWSLRIGQSLVYTGELGQSDIILVENLDSPDYLLFEQATALYKAGFASRIVVPALASQDPEKANIVSQGIVELMARVARMQAPEIIPIQHIEPISLNTALQLREFLAKEYIRAIIVVTSGFRSKRSYLAYHAVFTPSGIKVYCMPVFGQKTPENWTKTWHGIQEVTKQFLKLQFYRFHVLRNRPPESWYRPLVDQSKNHG